MRAWGESSSFEGGDSGVDLKAFQQVETRPRGEWGVAAVEGEKPRSIHSFTHVSKIVSAPWVPGTVPRLGLASVTNAKISALKELSF